MNMKRIYKSIIMVAALLIWTAVLLWLNPCGDIKELTYSSAFAADSTIPIGGESEYSQTFDVTVPFNTIKLYLDNSDLARTDRTVQLRLQYEDESIEEKVIHTGKIASDELEWKLSKACDRLGMYQLTINVLNVDNGESVPVYFKAATDPNTGIQNICMNRYQRYTNYFAMIAIIGTILLIFIWGVLHYAPLKNTAPILILGMGLIMMAIMSPLSGPDERYHYLSAYKLSNLILGQDDIESVDLNYYIDDDLTLHYNNAENFVAVYKKWNDSYQENLGFRNISIEHVNDLKYPIPYVFSACGIALGRLLGVGFYKAYYLGRLFNLLAYVLITAVAIRFTHKFRELFILLALLPINLQQAASYSYDMIIIAVSLLFFAYFLRAMNKENGIDWKDIVSMSLMILIFSGTKLIYFVLVVEMLILFKWKKSTTIDKVALCVTVGIEGIAALYMLVRYAKMMNLHINPLYTFSDAVSNPLYFLKVVCSSYIKNGGKWLEEILGRWLAGMTVVIPQIFIMGFAVIILLAAARNQKDAIMLTKMGRACMIGSLCIGGLLMTLALWTDTAYRSATIDIIQGRYFVPFMIPFLLIINSGLKYTWNGSKRELITVYFALQISVVVSVLNQIAL